MNIKKVKEHSIQDIEENSAISIILKNREIVETEEEFFKLSWEDVQSPTNLDNIEQAANKIIDHWEKESKFMVLVDCDVDGYTSASLLVSYLTELTETFVDSNINIEIVHQEEKVHGLSPKIMVDIRDTIKPDILIIPDASCTAIQREALEEMNIDTIVIDHHDTLEEESNEKTIIVNNQHSKNYKNKNLSGVGVVWQVCRLIDQKLKRKIANNYLDIVATGLVADVMDLRSRETRFLVREGLKPENIKNPLLVQALKANKFKLGGELTPTKIAFNIAPLINAVTRIGEGSDKKIALEAMMSHTASNLVKNGKRGASGEVELVEEAYRLISNAKTRQTTRQNKMMKNIDDIIRLDNLLDNKVLLVALEEGDFENSHKGLAGLVCNKLQDTYQRPVIIVFEREEGHFIGSMRAPDTIEAFANFKDQCSESGLFTLAAGHQQAAGVGFKAENIEDINNYFNEKFAEIDLSATFFCDFVFDCSSGGLFETVFDLANYADIWGQGIKEPVIAVENVILDHSSLSLVGMDKGRPTLKIKADGVEFIKFGSSQEEFDALSAPFRQDTPQFYNVSIVGKTPTLNEFRGKLTPQMILSEYEIIKTEFDF